MFRIVASMRAQHELNRLPCIPGQGLRASTQLCTALLNSEQQARVTYVRHIVTRLGR